MPKTADKFNVQSDITLVFESVGKKYEMRLIISSGLIMLKGEKDEEERIIFIDDSSHYTGEPVKAEVVEEEKPVEVAEKPKRKRKSKKKK